MKKDKVQEAFLEQLRKVPIVQVCCEKLNVSRNSVYRWRKDDPEFRKRMDEAMAEGDALVNDMSESQLLALIREKNWSAISFWLSRRNPKFRDKLEMNGSVDLHDDSLSPEQEAIVRKALEFGFTKPKKP